MRELGRDPRFRKEGLGDGFFFGGLTAEAFDDYETVDSRGTGGEQLSRPRALRELRQDLVATGGGTCLSVGHGLALYPTLGPRSGEG
jgi:hypothetical protein